MIITNYIECIKEKISKNSPFPIDNFGKLIRSKIGILVLKSLNIEISDNHTDFLTACEFIHIASLLHDDVLDESSERRGKITFRKLFSDKISILYGNLFLSKSFDILLKFEKYELMSLFNSTVQKMCEGELIQNSQINKIPTIDEYLKKTDLKTAQFFKSIIKGLNILSLGRIPDKMCSFAQKFGMAFQIKNDLDNVLTDKSDIKSGIYTAPVIFSNKIDITPDGIEKTRCLIDNYTQEAISELEKISESIYKKELIEVVECLKN